MRILFVNDYGHLFGGAETYALALARGLESRGHVVEWLTSDSRGGGPLATFPEGAPRFHAGAVCRGVTGGSAVRRAIDQWANPSAERELRRTLERFRPDVVHLHGYLGRLSPRVLRPLADVPTAATLHTYKAICPKGTKVLPSAHACRTPFGTGCVTRRCLSPAGYLHERTKRVFSGSVFRHIRLALAPSRYLLERFSEEAPSLPLRHFPYGTSLHECRRPKRNGHGQLLFVGRLSPSKGVAMLLQALVGVPHARLVVAGEGPERKRLEALSRCLGLANRVSFRGHVSEDEVVRLHSESDALVVPSRWPEVSGITILEALALGTPVVAFAEGGIPELVSDDVGWCIGSADPESLPRALHASLASPRQRVAMEAACLARAESYRLRTQVEALEGLYLALADSRPYI